MQDSKGYVWFCTEAGVNRFDGRHFETFTTRDGLSDNENFRCYEDSRGRIWFLSYNGKLSFFYKGHFVNEDNDSTLKYAARQGKFLRDILEDKNGNIWFSTFLGGIFMYDNKKIVAMDNKYKSILTPVLFSNENRIYTLGADSAGCVLDDIIANTATRLKSKIRAPRFFHYTLRHNGVQYFVSDTGIEHLCGDSLVTDITNLQAGCTILNFAAVGNDLWLASYGKGVLLLHNFFIGGNAPQKTAILEKGTVPWILFDNENGVWVSTMSEGVYYQPAARSYITNIAAKAVTSIKHSRKSGLWATGNYDGMLTIYDLDKPVKTYIHPRLPETRIKALSWLPANRVLVGMDYTPYLFDLDKKAASFLFNEYEGISDLYDRRSALWICARNKIFVLDSTGNIRCVYKSPMANAASDKLVSVTCNDDGDAFFTSIRDLYKVTKNGKVVRIAGSEVFNSNLKDLEYANGMIWVATHGNGIFVFRGTEFVKHIFSGNSNITSDICQKLIYDKGQKMWLATNKGISVFDCRNYEYLYRLTTDDVLINNDVKDIDLYDNKAYVATASGISIIDVNRFASASAPPPVYIRKLIAGKTEYADYTTPEFKYFKGDITLSYSAVTFQANQSTRYRYKLKDKDTTWYETASDQVTFHNMSPGTYTFEVQAKKYNTAWSPAASFAFTVVPLWFQHVAFKAGCVLLFIAFIYVFYVFQVRAVKKREQEKTDHNKRVAELEGSALASQMNPHFIFNSLNTIQQLMLVKNEELGLQYIGDFSMLIRQILEYSRHQYIDVQEEIGFLQRYLQLEQVRFSNSFTFSFHTGGITSCDIKIPPMLIQPLLENAVKHAFVAGDKHVDISFKLEEEMLTVEVNDNGIGINTARAHSIKKEGLHESAALKVIESRLRLLQDTNGKRGSMTVMDKSGSGTGKTGTCITLIIPIKKERWE